MEAFDASAVKEPKKTGTLWRIYYGVRLPSLASEFFKLTATEGPRTGESLRQFHICLILTRISHQHLAIQGTAVSSLRLRYTFS